MELVILSTIAAAAILVAELRDLARHALIGRGVTPAVTSLATASRGAAIEEIVAPQPGLDRAA